MSYLRTFGRVSIAALLAGCSSSSASSTVGDAHDAAVDAVTRTVGSGQSSTSASSSNSAGGQSSSSGQTGSTATSASSGPSGATSGIDGGQEAGDAAVGATTLRIHYPVGSHTLTIRGALAPLSWTTDTALVAASGATDTFTITIPSLAGSLEWKPLLDGTTWAIGSNYHVDPGQTLDVYPHFTSTKGQVETLIQSFSSSVLGNTRTIYAYLPASYAENTVASYPVVYMHDGQNLWAALPQLAFSGTWNVDTAFDAASNTGTCSAGGVVGWGAQPLGGTPTTCNGDSDCGTGGQCRTFPEAIVIGVANDSQRVYEYTPTTDPSEADAGLGAEGGADLYLKMLVTELKPKIDAMLRTRPDVASTTMAGSSLGGLVTAYAGLKYPSVYGQIAALSPSSWWDDDVIVADVMGTLAAPNRPGIVYVDSGEGTVDDEEDTDQLAAAYVALGYVANVNYRHVIQSGAAHNETYWAERFPGAMQLVLGAR